MKEIAGNFGKDLMGENQKLRSLLEKVKKHEDQYVIDEGSFWDKFMKEYDEVMK